jgi:hypothetical protein
MLALGTSPVPPAVPEFGVGGLGTVEEAIAAESARRLVGESEW